VLTTPALARGSPPELVQSQPTAPLYYHTMIPIGLLKSPHACGRHLLSVLHPVYIQSILLQSTWSHRSSLAQVPRFAPPQLPFPFIGHLPSQEHMNPEKFDPRPYDPTLNSRFCQKSCRLGRPVRYRLADFNKDLTRTLCKPS